MWKFIRFELKHWLKSPMLWIFLFINTLLVFFAVASDNVSIGGGVGNVYKNSPFVIQGYYMLLSIICLLMTTSFMNATANRDFSSGMHQFVFSSPINKRDYYFGKFIGAAIVSVIPFLGISLGALLAPLLAPSMDMCPPERFEAVVWSGHIWGILAFALPNVIISGVLLYGLAIIYKSNIVSFIGSMLIIVIYAVSRIYTRDIKKEWLANLLDPFGGQPFRTITKYATIEEKNLNAITLHGDLLTNRLVWLGISLLILVVIYIRFSFSTKNEKTKKVKVKQDVAPPLMTQNIAIQASKSGIFSLTIFWSLVKFEIKAVIKNPTFIIVVSIGLINLIASLTTFTGRYGATQYPVTYDVVDSIRGAFSLFMYGFITFYAGVLVWKERDAKINEIQDATPIKTGMLFLSKFVAIIAAIALVMVLTIIIGILAQTFKGYYDYEIGVYVKSLLVIDMITFTYSVILALLFHYLINNRYIAYFAFVVFIIANGFVWRFLEINTNMVSFDSTPRITYSAMNGFGPFVPSTVWFNIYWGLFCVLLGFVILFFYIRGKETDFKQRWQNAKLQLNENKLVAGFSLLTFLLCGSFVFYNTKVLNKYDTVKEGENSQVNYEKKYKKYQYLNQPRYVSFDYSIDIMPEERSMTAKIGAWVKNKSNLPINEIHFTVPPFADTTKIEIAEAKLKLNDADLYYRIYTLNKPLAPNDSIKINFDLSKTTRGFENEVSFTELTQNGTFFNNSNILPIIGYSVNGEITEKNKRIKLGLPKRERMPKLEENNMIVRGNPYISSDADWVNVSTTISTSPDQVAIAPGSLIKTWDANGRKYFKYQLDHKSFNFYSFISAKYAVARKKWNGIDLEVYYHPQHATNVPNMLKSLQKSLEYYTTNFGPYVHKQCRILEFPRYAGFAQAFPGTMPYSESIGFITDLREVNKDKIDGVFYVVAHEMGHQYWAHQVCGPNMAGSEMFSEGFAQYSALMVMEKEYGKDKMKQFLKYEMNDYLNGRGSEFEGESPLMKTEHQGYIHYEKASVVMYYLKEMIGEKNVNTALKNIVSKYAYQNPPYATSIDVVNELRAVTPDSLKYLIGDLFENITLFSNRALEVKYKKVGAEYEVTIKTTSDKFRANSQGKETAVPLSDYIDIGVFGESKESDILGKVLVYKRLKITKKENTFVFKTKEKPSEAGIDPYNYLIDRIPNDNLKAAEE